VQDAISLLVDFGWLAACQERDEKDEEAITGKTTTQDRGGL